MRNINLTEGNIAQALIKLAIPIMGTSFVQMAYNLTDLLWIGRVSSDAVAAVGTAGFFTWVSVAFILLSRVGTEVGVAQSVGKGDMDLARKYVRGGLQINLSLGIAYSVFVIIFKAYLIGFFNVEDAKVVADAIAYLAIVILGQPFQFLNQLFSGVFNGYGDSRTPFRVNSVGLIANMILDPLLILGYGPFPRLEVLGAALATVMAQFVVTLLFLIKIKDHPLFESLDFTRSIEPCRIKKIVTIGLPVALQEGLFASFAMVITRIIAQWGPAPIAVQKIGAQIEAISWMTARGFSTALSAFVGQNYGARKWDRINQGYKVAMSIMAGIGVFATLLLYFGAEPLFYLFLPQEDTLREGIIYLEILSIAQLFMCTEIVTAGAFNGLGKTLPPAVVSIVFTGLRIPVALILSSENLLGLQGVWWTITLSCVAKGIILPLLYWRHRRSTLASTYEMV